ncbi:hypothetical protein Tco_1362842 [Tanacetum coccineum]
MDEKEGSGSQKASRICIWSIHLKIARKSRVLIEEIIHSLSTPVYCRDLDRTTLRELIDSEDRLIPNILVDDVQRVAAQRALRDQRASMQDLYECMGSMEIRQEAIERMKYKQSYHWDRYQGVFEHMAGVYSVPLQGAYNPPGYAQPQYDQYYQQYYPQATTTAAGMIDEEDGVVRMTHEGYLIVCVCMVFVALSETVIVQPVFAEDTSASVIQFSLVDNSKLNDVDLLLRRLKQNVSLLEGLQGGKKIAFFKGIKQSPRNEYF